MKIFESFSTRDHQTQYVDFKNEVIRYCGGIENNLKSGNGLTLCGSVGTGKTFMMKLMYKWLKNWCYEMNEKIPEYERITGEDGIDQFRINKQIRILFINNMEIIFNVNDYDKLQKLRDVSILMIDDFGIGIPSKLEFKYNQVCRYYYDFINYRYEHLLPIILSTNYVYVSKDNLFDYHKIFGEQYAPLIIRRIRERNIYVEIKDKITFYDWRKQNE